MKRIVAHLIIGLIIVLALAMSADGQCSAGPTSSSERPMQPTYVLLEKSAISSPDGEHPVFKLADANSELARAAAVLLEQSYAQESLVLHQYVKNFLAHQPGVDPAVASEPTYFVPGGTGGYANLGFWLEDDQGQIIDKRTTSYVWGLSVDEGYWGDFEQLFPHELGHVMLAELAGWQQGTLAAQIHQVTMVTDHFVAFNEGWAEHFQAVAVDHTTNTKVQALREMRLPVGEQGPYGRLARELKGRCLLCPAKTSLPLWHGQREQHLRYAGVKTNLFAHQPTIPEVLVDREDPHAALLYQVIIPPDGTGTLRNGSQMLANEGLISTLFYRLVSDPHLQQTYREPTFYESFLTPGYKVDWSHTSPEELFSPMENVYLKLFQVFARYVRLDGDLFGESPTILVLKGYAADYPDEAEAVYDVFLEITQGVTVEPRALQIAQDWVAARLTTAEHQAYLNGLRQRLLAGQTEVDSGLGPQIWLRNPKVQVGVWALDAYASILPRPYHFNLNAATVIDLRTVPGIDVQLAREIVRLRDERGGFSALDDLAGIPGVTPQILDRLLDMHQAVQPWSEDEVDLEVESVVWILAKRLLLELALALAMAGLIFAIGTFLHAATAKRLGLKVTPAGRDCVGGKARRTILCLGRVLVLAISTLVAVVLPVMVFFIFQFWLLLKNSPQIPGLALTFIFAIATWFFVSLPRLGWCLVRRQPGNRAALHRAAWALLTYAVMFGIVGWLMGA
jgi:hypothetical protein